MTSRTCTDKNPDSIRALSKEGSEPIHVIEPPIIRMRWMPTQYDSRRGRTMPRKKSLRSQLYRNARVLGNFESAAKGPVSYGKRVARRKVYAKTNSLTRKLLRSLGLSK
jgi:hypothetical protein